MFHDIFDVVENSAYDHSSIDTKNHKSKDSYTDYFDYFYKTVQIDNRIFDLVVNVKRKYGDKGGFITGIFKDRANGDLSYIIISMLKYFS